jgi:hypothetical protein
MTNRSDQPPSRSKVTAEKRDATATITANAWAVRKLLHASGMDARPGTIARKMVDHDLSAGCSYGTLKARIANDLRRADECERDGLWPPFDPDADLEDWEAGDDWSADSLLESESDLDRILRELNPDNYLVDEADDPLPAPPTNAVHACSQ